MSGITEFLASKLRALTPDKWDGFIRALDVRFSVLEDQLGIERRVTESILQRGVQVIEDGIGPAILEAEQSAARIAQIADLGMIFSATSSSTVTIGNGTGTRTFVIPEDGRAQFAPASILMAFSDENYSNSITGRAISYDRITGVLILAVLDKKGSGTFHHWRLTPASTTLDLEAMRDAVELDKLAADASAMAAGNAAENAATAAAAANTSRVQAQSAREVVTKIVAPSGTTPPSAPVNGQLWWDGEVVRVYDGEYFLPAVSASIGGMQFVKGQFGASPSGVIAVAGGFTTVMVFLNGALLKQGEEYTAATPDVTILHPQEGDEYFIWAYRAIDASDYFTKEETSTRLAAKWGASTATIDFGVL